MVCNSIRCLEHINHNPFEIYVYSQGLYFPKNPFTLSCFAIWTYLYVLDA